MPPLTAEFEDNREHWLNFKNSGVIYNNKKQRKNIK